MKKGILTSWFLLVYHICYAQTKPSPEVLSNQDNPLIPDKLVEIVIPLVILYLVLDALVTFAKNRSEDQLKAKLIEKGVSEEALVKIFTQTALIRQLQPLKWTLFSLALGLSLLLIYLSRGYLTDSSGYFALSIILLCHAMASFIYYLLLTRDGKLTKI
ncbi:hypothetical protein GO755_37075 [Spirosoma sp. HMF4905]|uniref:Uncharacterized protein n=1 Tax=Spirosoma arboris TaxID=2682092 RepID=A0A7K1SPI2_9BACT|nr:hypothetical protein [Spirosoma arboris]MVM35687.1 hypothetical protein [Spirosoma arboris]